MPNRISDLGVTVFVDLSDMTNELAREWLMENDIDARDYWAATPNANLVEAVADNLKDFGYDAQLGNIIVLPPEVMNIQKPTRH